MEAAESATVLVACVTAVQENILRSHVPVDEAERVDGLQGLHNQLGMLANLAFGEQIEFLVLHDLYQVALVPEGPDDVDEVPINNVLEHRDNVFLFEVLQMALQGKLHQLLVDGL